MVASCTAQLCMLPIAFSRTRAHEGIQSTVRLISICWFHFLKGLEYPGSKGDDNKLWATPLAQ